MDLEATKCITSHKAAFSTYEVIATCNVHLDDESVVEAIGIASIVVKAFVRDKINRIHIKDKFHMPKLLANLLSVIKLVSNGFKIQFNLNECFIKV